MFVTEISVQIFDYFNLNESSLSSRFPRYIPNVCHQEISSIIFKGGRLLIVSHGEDISAACTCGRDQKELFASEILLPHRHFFERKHRYRD
jgi:hypothetical protein